MMNRSLLLAALLCLSATATAAATGTSSYNFWWNVGGDVFKNAAVSQYNIVPGNHTQTGNGCNTPGCKSWSQGLWPTITTDGKPVNGGVPQNANLSAHLDNIRATLPQWLPDPNYDGNAVFDFEAWTPLWEQNTSPGSHWHGKAYQTMSINLVKAQHPSWSSSQVNAAAQKAFETAALAFFVETMKLAVSMRPKAKWGYYGFPANPFYPCTNHECGYNNPIFGPILRAENDALQELWDASTALFPSIYIPPGEAALDTQNYINGTIQEATRRAKGRIPVRGFAWSYYHNGTTHLDTADLQSEMAMPYYHGADGVVIWGDPQGFKHIPDFQAYLASQLGPKCKALYEEFNA